MARPAAAELSGIGVPLAARRTTKTYDKGVALWTYHGLQLLADAKAAYEELTGRGLDVSEPQVFSPRDGGTFLYFSDPDGNGWAIQEYRQRTAQPLHWLLNEQAVEQR